jgi:pilus assembly protein CpaF
VRLFDAPGVQPIKHLLLDPDVSETMINGPQRLFVERRGVMQEQTPVFRSTQQIEVLIENLGAHTVRSVTVRSRIFDFPMAHE